MATASMAALRELKTLQEDCALKHPSLSPGLRPPNPVHSGRLCPQTPCDSGSSAPRPPSNVNGRGLTPKDREGRHSSRQNSRILSPKFHWSLKCIESHDINVYLDYICHITPMRLAKLLQPKRNRALCRANCPATVQSRRHVQIQCTNCGAGLTCSLDIRRIPAAWFMLDPSMAFS